MTTTDISLSFKKFHPDAIVPSYAHHNDAGCDLCTPVAITAVSRQITKIPLGLGIALPDGYMFMIYDKSGLASRGLQVVGGIVDAGYRGEIAVLLYNTTDADIAFESGNKVAQGIIVPVVQADFTQIDEFSETTRGAGGFGSTGA
jgi:dUTP pyrophosphatase